jgi:hypothetical protein
MSDSLPPELHQRVINSPGPDTDRAVQDYLSGKARSDAPPPARPLDGAALNARINDPRNDPRSRQFDRGFAEETDRLCGKPTNSEQSHAPSQQTSSAAAADHLPPGEFSGKVPTDIEGYRVDSEKLAPFAENLAQDEFYKEVRAFAMRAGITDAQFSTFVTPVMEKMASMSKGQRNAASAADNGDRTQSDLMQDLLELVPEPAMSLGPREQREAVGTRIRAALQFVDESVSARGLDAKVAKYIVEQLGDSQLGIRAIEFFRDQSFLDLSHHARGSRR